MALVMGAMVLGGAGAAAVAMRTSEVTIADAEPERMHFFIATVRREAISAQGMGVLLGRVAMGPMSPVEGRGGSPPAAPVAGVRIIISELSGREIAAALTDDDGGYSFGLPPGVYRIEMAPFTSGRFTKDLPATVTVEDGRERRLDIRIDTGMR